MRAVMFAVVSLSSAGHVIGQEFSSPLDVVNTLYNSYFMGVPLTDVSPYLSDDLLAQLDGARIGSEQFSEAGYDPITGFLVWDPREFSTHLLKQDAKSAQVKVSFTQNNVPADIVLNVVREADHGWQIDHIAGKAGDQTWCTNAIVSMASQKASQTGRTTSAQ